MKLDNVLVIFSRIINSFEYMSILKNMLRPAFKLHSDGDGNDFFQTAMDKENFN